MARSTRLFQGYAQLDEAAGLHVMDTPEARDVAGDRFVRMLSRSGAVSGRRPWRRFLRLIAIVAICLVALAIFWALVPLRPAAPAPQAAGQAPADQGGAVAPVPSAVAPSSSIALAPSPSAGQPSPSAAQPSPSAEAPSPSAEGPSPSSEQVAGDCPGTLLGSFDTETVLASSGGSAAAQKAFEISFTKDCVSLEVDPAGLSAGAEEVTGTFLLALDETDITSAASRSCVISIVWEGTLTGVYDVDGTKRVASGIGTGTITRSMTDGCTAISAANRRPVSRKAEDITWQVSGDGQTMAGEFVVVPSKGASPLLWNVELAAR
jgi:hypothetical protein